MNIMFTCVGRRVELIQEFKKTAEKYDVTIYGADASDTAPALFFCDSYCRSPLIKEDDYIPFLLRVCRENKIELLIPTIDTDLLVLSEMREQFRSVGTRVLISDTEIIRKCRDKRRTSEIFISADVAFPAGTDDAEKYDLGFPAFIKPFNGSSSINAYRADTREELAEYASRIGDYVIQPFIDGEEYTIDILCDFCGDPVYITPRKRLATRTGEVSKTEICNDPVMIREALRIVEVMKPCGPVTVQLIREKTSGKDWFIEINPRFGGGAPLSMKAGANSAEAIVALLSGEKREYCPCAAEDKLVFCRFDQSIQLPVM